jgi:hypothetical protein
MDINEIKPIIDKPIIDDFQDAISEPESVQESEPEIIFPSETENEDNTSHDTKLIQQLKENISRNSLAIADLKLPESNESRRSDESMPTTPLSRDTESLNKKNKRPKIFPRYVYADIFDEKISDNDNNEWTDLKRYRFQKCLWKLKYNRIVSIFYLDNLRYKESRWSWMIIVISTLTSGLTVANNVQGEPFDNYNTYINALLTVSSMSTSLIAAWIKKQMFIERINETDKYLLNINVLCEELEVQFSLLNGDRTSYIDFKKKYIPEITKFLTTSPMIPPHEWKNCIKEITLKYPELINPDNTEDNKLWPWYGDLVFDMDDNMVESHVRKPTTFMAHFKKTNTDRLRSTCCGKKTIKNVY